MKISTVNYFIGDAFKSFKRNKTISIATIITVLVTFIVLGTFSLVAENLNLAIGGLEDKIELVVYLNDDISPIDRKEVSTVKKKRMNFIKKVLKKFNMNQEKMPLRNYKKIMQEF